MLVLYNFPVILPIMTGCIVFLINGWWFQTWILRSISYNIYIYIFIHIYVYVMSSFPLAFIFFKMVKTTNQNQGLGPGSLSRGHPPRTLVTTFGSDGGSNGSDGARDVARWMAMEKWVIDRSDLTTPIASMYAICGNIYHQYTPFMLAYIPAPWIRHGTGII